VRFDPATLSLAGVLRAVAAIGYRAFPYDPARREALAVRERRDLITRMAVALLAMLQVMMFAIPVYLDPADVSFEQRRLLAWAGFVMTLPVIGYAARPIFAGAWRDVTHGRLGMDIPVAFGLLAAFAGSVWSTFVTAGPVYYDSITMLVAFLLVARFVDLAARQRAGAAIESAARELPATAERLTGWPAAQSFEVVPAADLAPGDLALVRPGSTIPADGTVVSGTSALSEAVWNGESRPRTVATGDTVLAGAMNREGMLVLRIDAAGPATRLASIVRLTERAAMHRPVIAHVAQRVAAGFVGVLLLITAATAWYWSQVDPARTLAIVFAVLAVSCPCALALGAPAALAAAVGRMAREHIVLARSDALETLARVTHVVLDKTGTLTQGTLALRRTIVFGEMPADRALALAAAIGAHSEHPAARALRTPADAGGALPPVQAVHNHPGSGVEAVVDGRRTRLGRASFVAELAGSAAAFATFGAQCAESSTLVALGDERGWLAGFELTDTLRAGSGALVAQLARLGVTPVLLSGDRASSVAALARTLRIADARGDLAPEDKRAAIAALQATGAVVAMVGDGINDAPALAQAQVSLTLGSAVPLAQWTADVVVLGDEVERVATALRCARRTISVIRQNFAWAILYNAMAIPAAAFGFITPQAAAVGMSLSSLIVVGNAARLARGERRDAAFAAAPAALAVP
jgi:Cu2+-exporting ATPase